jgi:hypothetical protein
MNDTWNILGTGGIKESCGDRRNVFKSDADGISRGTACMDYLHAHTYMCRLASRREKEAYLIDFLFVDTEEVISKSTGVMSSPSSSVVNGRRAAKRRKNCSVASDDGHCVLPSAGGQMLKSERRVGAARRRTRPTERRTVEGRNVHSSAANNAARNGDCSLRDASALDVDARSSDGVSPTVSRLGASFFDQPSRQLARSLLGKRLVRVADDGGRRVGAIVEAEAYAGFEDRAAHSFGGKRTPRNEATFMAPGTANVYNIHGRYACMNVSSSGIRRSSLFALTYALWSELVI